MMKMSVNPRTVRAQVCAEVNAFVAGAGMSKASPSIYLWPRLSICDCIYVCFKANARIS